MIFAKRHINLIISIVMAVVIWGLLSIIFDFYYDLNDDVLIKDIVSGIYTGTPDAHNNQMMYPLSLLFCGLYKLAPTISWFGIFEIECFVVSFVTISTSLLEYASRLYAKIALVLLLGILYTSLYLWELVMLQYTVVSGMLCATAGVLVITKNKSSNISDYIKENILAIILAIIAFNIRSEMFLLMCPFMAVAGIARWIQEPTAREHKLLSAEFSTNKYIGIFDLVNIKKYFTLIVVILAGIILTLEVDKLAYSSSDWKEFRRFFDARTDVYDFTGIPDYEANIAFYKANNISREQYDRLIDYNFDLDKTITADTFETIIEYVKSGNAHTVDGLPYGRLNRSIKTTMGEYVRGILRFDFRNEVSYDSPFQDETSHLAPFNIVVIMLYMTLMMLAISMRNWRIIIDIVSLILFRSIAWIYIYYKGRLVSRITHPMMMIEILIMITIIIQELGGYDTTDKQNDSKKICKMFIGNCFAYVIAILVILLCIFNVAITAKELTFKQALRDNINYAAIQLNEYTSSNDGYYMVDVYSTVSFTEPVFDWPICDKSNQQLAGGWIARSPLDANKIYGQNNIYFAYYNESKWIYEHKQ